MLVDALHLDARKGALGGGFLDMGAGSWFIATFLIWIIAFPCYLVARPRLLARKRRQQWPAPPLNHLALAPWGQPVMPPGPGSGTFTIPEDIERLHALLRTGAISEAEYAKLKQRVI